MKKPNTNFKLIKTQIQIVSDLLSYIERLQSDVTTKWGDTGETYEDFKYENGVKIILKDDDGNSIIKLRYDYIPKSEDEYTDEDYLRLEALDTMKDLIANMTKEILK